MSIKKKKGFTLIELLVVVAIIGILAAIGLIAVGDARVRARDTKRMADISQMRTVLGLFYDEVGRYPTGSKAVNGLCLTKEANFSSTCTGTLYYAVPAGISGGPCTGEPAVDNPKGGYYYDTDTDGSSFNLHFCLEKGTGGYAAGNLYATPAGILRQP